MADLGDLIDIIERLREAIDLRSPLFSRRTTGIEVTQAIQYYRSKSHLTDVNDQAPDNSATLVAFKPAIVRVYVRPAFGLTTDKPVTGTLLVERRQGVLGGWARLVTLSPWLSPTMTPVDDSYADERGTIWNSLNFRIPAANFAGHMRLTLKLDTGETRTTTVTANLVQTLRVRVIAVSYSGPDTANPPAGTVPPTLNLAAPTLADAQTTASSAFSMMPVQQTGSFALAGTLAWSNPLDDARTAPGRCSANWGLLLKALKTMRDNDGNRADVVYFGLLPAGIPLGVRGCGSVGLGSTAVGILDAFVHEMGHGYGFQHTPSGNAGNTDPNYPDYEPYMSASIGEYGVNIQDGTVYSPATSNDYMSYGRNRWMSLYQHKRLINHPRLAPNWIRERHPLDRLPIEVKPWPWWWPEPPWELDDREKYSLQKLISVRGIIDEKGIVQVDSVARVSASPVSLGPETSWSAQLIGRAGGIASRARLTRVLTYGGEGCGCGCSGEKGDPNQLPLEFQALVPDVEPGTALRIVDREGNDSWERCAPDDPPCFDGVDIVLNNGTLCISWSLEGCEPADIWAQHSSDGGKTWHGLAVGLAGDSADISAAGLSAGKVLIRLLAHDGFSTATSDPVPVKVPERAPYPAILYPSDGEVVAANTEIEVLGSAVDQGGFPVEEDCLEWIVDGRPIEKRGRTGLMKVKKGDHKLTLRVRARKEAEVTVKFTAQPVEG